MAKPRASTIQQRFGFQDGDLKMPKHDEMMLWLDENLLCVMAQALPPYDPGLTEACERGCPEEILNAKHMRYLENRTWEYPVVDHKYGGGKYVIGFVDLVACYIVWGLHKWTDGWHWIQERKYIYFEVKTAIPSLGELIRQVRMYQQYLDKDIPFVVVCPDARFKEPLRSQGIGFVHYRSGEV